MKKKQKKIKNLEKEIIDIKNMGNKASKSVPTLPQMPKYQVRAIRIFENKVDLATLTLTHIPNSQGIPQLILPFELTNEAVRVGVRLSMNQIPHVQNSSIAFNIYHGLRNAREPSKEVIFVVKIQKQVKASIQLEMPMSFNSQSPDFGYETQWIKQHLQQHSQKEEQSKGFNPQKHMQQLTGRPNVPYIDSGAHVGTMPSPASMSNLQYRSATQFTQQPYYQQTLNR